MERPWSATETWCRLWMWWGVWVRPAAIWLWAALLAWSNSCQYEKDCSILSAPAAVQKNECRLSFSSLANTSQGGWKHFFVIAFNSMLGVAALPLLRLRLSWGKLSNLLSSGLLCFLRGNRVDVTLTKREMMPHTGSDTCYFLYSRCQRRNTRVKWLDSGPTPVATTVLPLVQKAPVLYMSLFCLCVQIANILLC